MPSSKQENLADGLLYDDQTSGSLQILLKNISSLSQTVELQTVLKDSLQIICNVMNVKASSLMLLDQSSGELIVSMPTGPIQKEITGERLAEGAGIGGWVIKNEEPFYSNDLQNSDIFGGDLSEDFTTYNMMCVPLKDKKGHIFGVIEAINRLDERDFNDGDIPIFQALADHLALTIERTRKFEKVQEQLKEKEMILAEVHHRLKNNLSTITALIEMEFSEVDNEKAEQVLRKTVSRIESMTEVHDFLYTRSLGNEIDLKSYLERLSEKIASTLSYPTQEIAIDVQAEPLLLDAERVFSCGLLLNELMVNSYKHAFKNNTQTGRIIIELRKSENDFVTLQVSDNGVGIGDNFSVDDSSSTGGWLINVLLRRLDATVDITQNNGTTFIIRFKK